MTSSAAAMQDTLRAGYFLTWQSHQRTVQIGKSTGIDVKILQTSRSGLLRYAELAWRSLQLLRRTRPAWLIVQSPSYVLAGLAVTLGRLYTRCVIVDAHNEAVRPFINDTTVVRWLARTIMRSADAVIVTNDELAAIVTRAGGQPLVLPDPLPEPEPVEPARLGPGKHAAVICTYAPDEPVAALLEGARGAAEGWTFHFTGAVRNLDPVLHDNSPPNVRYTGFLPEPEYWALLRGVDVVIDVTLMPDCLVCGAYESLAVGVPMVLSDIPAARRLFDGAAIFAEPDGDGIARAIASLDVSLAGLRRQLPLVAARFASDWDEQKRRFVAKLTEVSSRERRR